MSMRMTTLEIVFLCFLRIKVTGIRPLVPVQNSVSVEANALNVVVNLADVENITKWLDSILT